MKKILFVASEAVPFIKTGGLADVVGTLPKYYTKENYDVKVILPKYSFIADKWKEKIKSVIEFEETHILKIEHEGIEFYFIDNPHYFTSETPYGDTQLDVEKFAFFSKMTLAILPRLNFKPDVIHCHDWQTGLIPVYLDNLRKSDKFYCGIKTIMTIHNLQFQGRWNRKVMQKFTGLSSEYFTMDKLGIEEKDASYLKGALVYADFITTVSNSYAEEIKTAFYGEGLEDLLNDRSDVLCGIINGIDYEEYNPKTDSMIIQNFDAADFQTEKIKNKIALQKELHLTEDPETMMIGVVSRLTSQKGFDMVETVLDELCSDRIQLVVLGTGEARYEKMFKHYAKKYPAQISANIYYSEEMSHKIYASCDMFLMPSLFEPCGLSQLMSLRYATVPLVRETGGLRDTVCAYNEYEKSGTGFSFANYNAYEMLFIIRYAQKFYYDSKEEWNEIAKRGMEEDFSWKHSAKQYEKLYDNITK